MHGNKRSNLIKRPWGVLLTVASGQTDFIKVPTGWVIEDLSIAGFSGYDVNLSVSSDVNATTYQAYAAGDLHGKNLPLSFDFFSTTFYPSNGMGISWNNIGVAELRSIQMQNNSGFQDHSLVIWGVLIPDPRCFQGE